MMKDHKAARTSTRILSHQNNHSKSTKHSIQISKKVQTFPNKNTSKMQINIQKKAQLSELQIKQLNDLAIAHELILDIEETSMMDMVSFDYSAKLPTKQILVENAQDLSQQGQILIERSRKLLKILEFNPKQKQKNNTLQQNKNKYVGPSPTPRNLLLTQEQVMQQKNEKNKEISALNFFNAGPISSNRVPQNKITQLNRYEYFLHPETTQTEINYQEDEQQEINPRLQYNMLHRQTQPENHTSDHHQQNQITCEQKHRRTQTANLSNHQKIYDHLKRSPKIEKVVLRNRKTEKSQLPSQTQSDQNNRKDQLLKQLRKQFSSICYNNQYSEEEKKVADELKQLQYQLSEIASNSTPRIFPQQNQSRFVGKFEHSRISEQPAPDSKGRQQHKNYQDNSIVKTVRVSLTPPKTKNNQTRQQKPIILHQKQPKQQKNETSKPKLLSGRINNVLRY